MILDAYSRCYVVPTAYACAMTSRNNRRDDPGGVLCGPAPRLYYSTDRVQFSVLTNNRRALSSERALHMDRIVTFKQE
jgi:hypothetical protein